VHPTSRRVVHRFQSGEEEYIETTTTTATGLGQTTILTPAAKKQLGVGQPQGDTTILLQADRLPSILQVGDFPFYLSIYTVTVCSYLPVTGILLDFNPKKG